MPHRKPTHFGSLRSPQVLPQVLPRMFSISHIRQLLLLSALCVLTHTKAGQHGPTLTQQTCDARFEWDSEDGATCTPSGGYKHDCELSSCSFNQQPLNEKTFIFYQCSPMERAGPPAHSVSVVWFQNNRTGQADYPLDVYGVAGMGAVRWTCPVGPDLNDQRPTCKKCWRSSNHL